MPARVPTYSGPVAQPEGAPQVYDRAPFSIPYLAPRAGEQQQQEGREIISAAREGANIERNIQIANVKDNAGLYTSGVENVLTDGTNGYLHQLGKNALSSYHQTVESVTAMRQKTADGIADPTERALYMRVTQPTYTAALERINNHFAQQSHQYQMDASSGRAQTAAAAAIGAYNPDGDNTAYNQNILTQHSELQDQADMLGLDGPAARDYVLYGANGHGGVISTYEGVINHLITTGRSDAAKAYLKNVQDDVPAPALDRMRKAVRTASEQSDALTTAINLKQRFGDDLQAQEKALDGQFQAGKMSAQVHDLALSKLRGDYAIQQEADAQRDRQALGQVWQMHQQNPNATLADVPPATYSYLVQRNLGERAQGILKSDAANDNPALYLKLTQQAAQDPQGFLHEDITKFYPELSTAHRKSLESLYTGIEKQDAHTLSAVTLAHSTLTDMHADMVNAGINPNPTAVSGATPHKLAQLQASLHDAIMTLPADMPLDKRQEAARRMGLYMLKQAAVPGAGFLGMSKSEPIYDMTPEEQQAAHVVPPADHEHILELLQARGLPTDDATIARVYAAGRQGKK